MGANSVCECKSLLLRWRGREGLEMTGLRAPELVAPSVRRRPRELVLVLEFEFVVVLVMKDAETDAAVDADESLGRRRPRRKSSWLVEGKRGERSSTALATFIIDGSSSGLPERSQCDKTLSIPSFQGRVGKPRTSAKLHHLKEAIEEGTRRIGPSSRRLLPSIPTSCVHAHHSSTSSRGRSWCRLLNSSASSSS